MDSTFEKMVEQALVAVNNRKANNDNKHYIRITKDGYVIENPENYEDVILSNCDINTIDLSRMKNLKRLYIDNMSHGDLYGIPIPKSFTISICYAWEYLKQFDFSSAEDLSLCIMANDEEVSINSECLRNLRLDFKTEDGGLRDIKLNLTGCDNLESLVLSGMRLSKTDRISDLPNLKSITASGCEIHSLTWLQEYSLLKNASFRGCNVVDILGLEKLTSIELLNLDNNSIQDLSPLLNLNSLKELNICNNPSNNYQIDELRKNGVAVIASRQDKALKHLADEGDAAFLEKVVSDQCAEDLKPIEQFPIYRQKYILDARNLSFSERVKLKIQQEFQSFFYSITPWSIYGSVNNWQNREFYMNSMQSKYPFLNTQDHMIEAIKLEKQQFCDASKDNNLVFILSDNIVNVEVSISHDRTGLAIHHEASFRLSDIEEKVIKYWPSEYDNFWQDSFMEISILGKYSGLESESILFPVIISALAYSLGCCDGKTAIIGDFNKNGTLKKETASNTNISISDNEGAKNVFIYGKASSYDKKILSQHDLNYFYVEDFKDIIEKMKENKSSGFEQISLMEFLKTHD